MKPLDNFIIIRADRAKERSKSGLYIKEDWDKLPPYGTVENVGPLVAPIIQPGVRVLYNRYAGTVIEENLRLISDDDVFAILEDKDESKTD